MLEVRIVVHFERVGGWDPKEPSATSNRVAVFCSLTLVSEPWCVQCDIFSGVNVHAMRAFSCRYHVFLNVYQQHRAEGKEYYIVT